MTDTTEIKNLSNNTKDEVFSDHNPLSTQMMHEVYREAKKNANRSYCDKQSKPLS